jgi:hypothetical protein
LEAQTAANGGQKLRTKRSTAVKTQPFLPPTLGEFLSVEIQASRDEACAKMDEPGVARDWLMIPIVDQLVAAGYVLIAGQCYSYRMLPVLGGTYKADNRVVLPIREHFGAWGSIHRQISDLPNGAEVVIKTVA